MLINKKVIICLVGLFFFSCKYNEFDAEQAAKDYCDCLEKERKSGKDFLDARTKCDGELLAKNRYFRISYIDDNYSYRHYVLLLPQNVRDSAATFFGIFYSYIEKNCCKNAIMGCDKSDSLQIKMKNINIQ